jgi:hypothetical protein
MKMLRHFIRQLFGLPVGGEFRDVRIRFMDHGRFRITVGKLATEIQISSKQLEGSRVSRIREDSLNQWSNGTALSQSEKARLIAATTYWLETQGNEVELS